MYIEITKVARTRRRVVSGWRRQLHADAHAMAGVTSSLGLLASSYEEEEAAAAPAAASGSTVLVVNAAPTVLVEYGGAGTSKAPIFKMEEDAKHGQLVMKSNPEYEDMWAPEQGPTLDPAAQRAAGIKSKHRFVGHVARYEPATHFAFEEQYHTFNAFGFASDPSTGAGPSGQNDVLGPQQAAVAGIVGDIERWAEARGESVFTRKEPLDSKLEAQRKRLRLDENYDQIPTSAPELTAEQKAAIDARLKQEKRRYEGREEEGDKPNMEEKAIFHGGSMTDYQGRSWLTPPTDVKEEEHECFIPKTWLHTWSGHTKGVAAIRWVPPVGHMLLSAGMDSKVKIWDVFNSRKCMQTCALCHPTPTPTHPPTPRPRPLRAFARALQPGPTPVPCHPPTHPPNAHTEPSARALRPSPTPVPCRGPLPPPPSAPPPGRRYQGHSAAVRDICLTNDGRRFLTCSYDRYMKLWDTETGQCISAFTNRKLCYCVKFNPDPALQNVFLAGCSNKHVVQYDTNTGKVEQVWVLHASSTPVFAPHIHARMHIRIRTCSHAACTPVFASASTPNSPLLADLRPASGRRQHHHVCRRQQALRLDRRRQEDAHLGVGHPGAHCRARRPIATAMRSRSRSHPRTPPLHASDFPLMRHPRSLRPPRPRPHPPHLRPRAPRTPPPPKPLAETLAQVPIKHIADPTLHSMPAVTKTPNDKWMLCQNLDNQITCYGATDRFKLNRKKVFKGHIVAGYACQVGVSSDGNWVMSGDSEGRLWFWDWKSCKVFRKIKCHDQVCIGAIWHPIESSRVATCSWDGTIKYWD